MTENPFTDFLAQRCGQWPPPVGALPPGYPNMTWETYVTNAVVDFMDDMARRAVWSAVADGYDSTGALRPRA